MACVRRATAARHRAGVGAGLTAGEWQRARTVKVAALYPGSTESTQRHWAAANVIPQGTLGVRCHSLTDALPVRTARWRIERRWWS